ncbi:MAG: hypothetical protein ABIN48_08015 [Ginsengibacter sp.]
MNIKINKILFTAVAFTLVVAGCKKDTFDHQMYEPSVAEIDSVYFSPGADKLVADGQAKLKFVVEAFRKISKETPSGRKDTLVKIDHRLLPKGSVQILMNGQPYDKMEYSTTTYSPTNLTFSAKIGKATSKPFEVALRQKQVLLQKVNVDVVFHVFELKNTDPAYDHLTYQNVTQDLLEKAIEDMNNVFNNVYGDNPNGGNANIHFRLAEKNAAGSKLTKPGYNMISYDKSWMKFTFFSPNDFFNKVNEIASYTWDPKRFLNIYIIPSGANNSMGNNTPNHQIVPSGQSPIPGITNIITNASQLPTGTNYTVYGVGVPRTLLFPGTDRRIELSPFIGTYYGLKRTGVASPTFEDYCDDTRLYIATNQFQELVKTGIDGMKFLADNAMDDSRYPSLRNSFTIDQVSRIRAVMANCPARMHGQP